MPLHNLTYRPIAVGDIEALFTVRIATDENRLTRNELTALGINEQSVADKLATTYHGWLCESGDEVVGFAMGDAATGELWVIAVLPQFIGRGIGSTLIQHVEAWLWSKGCTELWLTTDVDTRLRAYAFYRKHGWVDDCIKDGLRYMKKKPVR
ncbi:MAG: GNAT family N-acetyltransferase [Verrucomicrobiota bacterium]|nr:GNAT family N-acetyltransferase [Verrucomicrobiota bacterium]